MNVKKSATVVVAGMLLFMLGLILLVPSASATPPINSAVVRTRIFNDDPDSILTTTDNYPALISITDDVLDGDGMGGEFANRHNWRFSTDDTSPAVFSNDDQFSFAADLVISGTGEGEAGLNISPWWSQDVDGVFNVRSTDGEIAVFGGRLPFYGFTSSLGVTYTKGETIRLGMDYRPNSLSALDPATVEYTVSLGGMDYTSGPLPFDQGNPGEDPPYGLWGILNDARVGGFVQAFIDVGNPINNLTAEWTNITFVPEPTGLTLLALGCLAVAGRRSRS